MLQSHRKPHQASQRGFQQGAFAMGFSSRGDEAVLEKESAKGAFMIMVCKTLRLHRRLRLAK